MDTKTLITVKKKKRPRAFILLNRNLGSGWNVKSQNQSLSLTFYVLNVYVLSKYLVYTSFWSVVSLK